VCRGMPSCPWVSCGDATRGGLWDFCGAKDSQFKLSARLCVAGIEQTPHWLACHLSDQLVVMVDVQYLGTV